MSGPPRASFADLVERFEERANAETEDEFARSDNRCRVAVWRYAVRLAMVHARNGRQRPTRSKSRP